MPPYDTYMFLILGNNMNYPYGGMHGNFYIQSAYQAGGYLMKNDSSGTSQQPANIKKEAEETPGCPAKENIPSLHKEERESIRQGAEIRQSSCSPKEF